MNKKANKITVEIDIDEFISNEKRQDALYKAISEKVNGNYFLKDLQSQLIEKLIADVTLSRLSKVFDDAFLSIYTKEKVTEIVNGDSYNISRQIRSQMVDKVKLIESEIIEAMKKKGFAKKTAENLSKHVEARLIEKLVTNWEDE